MQFTDYFTCLSYLIYYYKYSDDYSVTRSTRRAQPFAERDADPGTVDPDRDPHNHHSLIDCYLVHAPSSLENVDPNRLKLWVILRGHTETDEEQYKQREAKQLVSFGGSNNKLNCLMSDFCR